MRPIQTNGPTPGLETEAGPPLMRLLLRVNDFVLDWRRYNLVSNYMAEYSSYFFEQKDRAENLISSVFYELIGHLSSCANPDSRIDIRFSVREGWLLFAISATIPRGELGWLKELLEEIERGDLDASYRSLLEADLSVPAVYRKMGLIMLAHDYRARLSARLDEKEGMATVHAVIRQEEIDT